MIEPFVPSLVFPPSEEKAGNALEVAEVENISSSMPMLSSQDLVFRTSAYVLWHYTSQSGLLGILRKRALWLSDVRYVNDAAEFRYLKEVLQRVLTRRFAAEGLGQHGELMAELVRGADNYPTAERFVFSLSERENDLSQWRGYAPPDGGFALGFETRRLKTIAASHGFRLMKCEYDPAKQDAMIDAYWESHFQPWIQAKVATNEAEATKHGRSIAEAIAELAPRMKNPVFESEHEWRLVSPAPLPRGIEIKLRPGRTIPVPYIELPFVRREMLDNVMFPILFLRFGPSSNGALSDLAVSAVRIALEAALRDPNSDWRPSWDAAFPQVKASGAPLRFI